MPSQRSTIGTPDGSVGRFLEVWGSILTFVALILIFSLMSASFRTVPNLVNVLTHAAPVLIIAMGVTLANMTGETDLSFGGTVGLSASLFCGYIGQGESIALATLVAVGAAVLLAFLVGSLVSIGGLSSFISSLAVLFMAQGLEYAYSGGQSLWVRDHPVTKVVTASVGGVPVILMIAGALFVVVYIVMHQTRTGLHIRSVGLSQEAAQYAGISTKWIKLVMFTLAGVFYASGGILHALRSSGSIIYSGQRLLLPVLAVTFISMTILGTKKPNIPGILIGAVLLTSISAAFTLLGYDFYYTLIAQGAVLLFAAILSVDNRSIILQEDLK